MHVLITDRSKMPHNVPDDRYNNIPMYVPGELAVVYIGGIRKYGRVIALNENNHRNFQLFETGEKVFITNNRIQPATEAECERFGGRFLNEK